MTGCERPASHIGPRCSRSRLESISRQSYLAERRGENRMSEGERILAKDESQAEKVREDRERQPRPRADLNRMGELKRVDTEHFNGAREKKGTSPGAGHAANQILPGIELGLQPPLVLHTSPCSDLRSVRSFAEPLLLNAARSRTRHRRPLEPKLSSSSLAKPSLITLPTLLNSGGRSRTSSLHPLLDSTLSGA